VGCPLVGSPKLGCPLVGSPKLGCPLVGSPKLGCPLVALHQWASFPELDRDECSIREVDWPVDLARLLETMHQRRMPNGWLPSGTGNNTWN
jgi:hypothetical protein